MDGLFERFVQLAEFPITIIDLGEHDVEGFDEDPNFVIPCLAQAKRQVGPGPDGRKGACELGERRHDPAHPPPREKGGEGHDRAGDTHRIKKEPQIFSPDPADLGMQIQRTYLLAAADESLPAP